MTPMRVGIIGLSSRTGAHEVGGWCAVAHMPFLKGSPKYQIIAITGRTVESAKKTVAAHGLPDTTKVYTSAKEIAADPDIDLVVVSLRVEKHFENTLPALQAGKNVFLEWPFGASTAEAEKMTQLAAEKGVKTFTGLEGRTDWLTQKVKQIIADGKIGKVICSTLSASSGLLPSSFWVEDAQYYLDMSSGGNDYHTYFGHLIDVFTYIHGDFDTVQATLKTQFPTAAIYNAEGKLVNDSYKRTAPDHILVQGSLASGAAGSLILRKAQDPVDGLGLRWLITGTRGEIEITCPEQHYSVGPPGRTLRLKIGKGETQDIDFSGPAGVFDPKWDYNSHNVALQYDAFAEGDTDRYATFESALKTRHLMDEIVEKSAFKV